MGSEGHTGGHEKHHGSFIMDYLSHRYNGCNVLVQAEKREARANQVKLDAQQLESLLFQLFERKVRQLWQPFFLIMT